MAVTSLAQQLSRLAAPQTSQLVDKKKRPSLLFHFKEAANIDKETFYSIGQEGLQELIIINRKAFTPYQHSLFDISSQSYVRSVETVETNKKLDEEIDAFLIHCSPYFILKPTLKALEWLVYRFQIHYYNTNSLMSLALPYHETMVFCRVLQLIPMKVENPTWQWLQPVKKEGVPLSKTALLNRAASDISFYRFVCTMPMLATKVYKGKDGKYLANLFTFYCTTIIGALERSGRITELQVSHLLPSILAGLHSKVVDYIASSYMILSYLATKTQLRADVLESLLLEVVKVLTKTELLLSESILLIVVLCQCKAKISEKCLEKLVNFKDFVKLLKKTAQTDVVIFPFVTELFSSLLRTIKSKGLSKESEDTIINIFNNIRFNKQEVEAFFRFFINNWPKLGDKDKDTWWFVGLLQNLEKQYPDSFDAVVTDKKFTETAKKLLAICNLPPAYAGQKELFMKLHHTNEAIRANTITLLSKQITPCKSWMSDSIAERLSDDSPLVVKAIFQLPRMYLEKLFTNESLVKHLSEAASRIWHQESSEWQKIAPIMLKRFCFVAANTVNLCTEVDRNILMTVTPYLISNDLQAAKVILSSPLTKHSKFLDCIAKEVIVDDCNKLNKATLQTAVWEALKNQSCLLPLEEIIKFENINGIVEKLIAILLAASAVTDKTDPTYSTKVMEWVNNLIQGTELYNENQDKLKEEGLGDMVALCRKGKLPLQIVQFLMCSLIKKTEMEFTQSTFGWYADSPTQEFLLGIFKSCAELQRTVGKKFRKFFGEIVKNLYQRHPKMEYSNLLCNMIVKCPEIADFCLMQLKTQLGEGSEREVDFLPVKLCPSNTIIPILIIALSSPDDKTRCLAFDMVSIINSKSDVKTSPYASICYFLIKLTAWREEIALDSEQLSVALYMLLSPDRTVQKAWSKSAQDDMMKVRNTLLDIITDPSAPAQIVASLLNVFAHITSVDIMEKLIGVAVRLMDWPTGKDEISRDESLILECIVKRIESSVVSVFEKDEIWIFAGKCLKLYGTQSSGPTKLNPPAVLFLEQISRELFDALPENGKKKLLDLVVSIITDIEIGEINSAANAMIKRIAIDSSSVLDILFTMRDVKVVPPENQKRRYSHGPTLQLLKTFEWRKGISLLESIQYKKKLANCHLLVAPLFEILKLCLQFVEQSPVEYAKQLLLSTILHACKKCMQEDKVTEIPSHAIQVELVVNCIRASQNPQTHHHALLVLSHITSMKPEEVLHNMMAIFTFMGSSVLRLDDAYSFQIILKTIENVIPILAQNVESEKTHTEQVKQVLQVFAAAILDIPEHRRLALIHKLVTTLSDDGHYLWLFICLVSESCVVSPETQQPSNIDLSRRKLEIVHDLCLEFTPETLLETMYRVVKHVTLLPREKDGGGVTDMKAAAELVVFDVKRNTGKQLRHYRYTLLGFVSSFLSSQPTVNMMVASNTKNENEGSLLKYFQQLIEVILEYMKEVSKQVELSINLPSAKYWKAMLNITYDLLSKTNALLPSKMFLEVMGSLLAHNIPKMRRKVMELLNWQLQSSIAFDPTGLISLLPSLLKIVRAGTRSTDNQLNRQTALISIKLLARKIAAQHPADFEQALSCVTELVRNSNECNTNEEFAVIASAILCLAELLATIGYKAIVYIPKFMPSLIEILSKTTTDNNVPEFLLPSIVMTLQKLMEYHSNFISPYLVNILTKVAIISASCEKKVIQKSQEIAIKIDLIRKNLSQVVPLRILLPAVEVSYSELVSERSYSAIPTLLSVLSNSPEQRLQKKNIHSFLFKALGFRDERTKGSVAIDAVAIVEPAVLSCVVSHVLKLNEEEFTSFYMMLSTWADTTSKTITFYKLILLFAETLKSLFVPFAKMFDRKACDVLNKNNTMKDNDEMFFGNTEDGFKKSAELVEAILRSFLIIFKYDSEHYITEKYFDYMMPALVDQLENKICINEGFLDNLLISCLANMATSIGDDSLWKKFNYQILLKTQHADLQVRLAGVKTICEVAKKLGDSYLPLLPETIPFLAELLEDEEEIVEKTCRSVVQELESILGEQISKYF